jgi:hypothetical protein
LRMRPIDPTRFYTPAPHQNRRFADPVEKVGLEADPISGAAVDDVVALIAATPPDIAERYAKAFAAPSPAQ